MMMMIKNYKKFISENLSIDKDGKISADIKFDDINDYLTHDEMEEYFKAIRDKWKVGEGRITSYHGREYWFPVEAKPDLDALGITWYTVDKVTNKEHKDYGKRFLVFNWLHKKF